MKLFLDSARTDEIRHALEVWNIDGLTTNPKHIAAAGKPFRKALAEIAELFAGTDKPVSVEVNPHLDDRREILAMGRELAELSPNFVIKVGAGAAGFAAIRDLTSEGIRTNATLIFTVTQAWHAARSGATYISPFVGWREAQGDEARQLIGEIATMLRAGGYGSQIIAAAIRNSRQMAEAAMAGAHCLTAGAAAIEESFRNPYTDFGNRVFGEAWDATPRE